MATLKVDKDRLPYLEDLALTLENESEFYEQYSQAKEALRARDLITTWKNKTAKSRAWAGGAAEDNTTADEREFLRRYFNQKWGFRQRESTAGRDAADSPGFPLFEQPAPEKPFDELWPAKPKPATPGPATDWASLPDGTTLITASGAKYTKGPGTPYQGCHPVSISSMKEQAAKGFVVGVSHKSRGSWNRWDKDGLSCSDTGKVYDTMTGHRLVSYELPVKPATPDPSLLRYKATEPIDYSKLPDGTRLFTKKRGVFIKGAPPPTLDDLPDDMRKPSFYTQSAPSGRPVYGYQVRDGKFDCWQNWRADGTLGAVSSAKDLELTGYDATPSGGLMPATHDAKVAAIRHAIEVIENSHHQPQLKEDTMNAIITITTKTLVNGQDVANFSNAQLYDLIAQQEKKLAELDAIKNKPKALKKELADRQAGIDALVAHLDSRDDSAAK